MAVDHQSNSRKRQEKKWSRAKTTKSKTWCHLYFKYNRPISVAFRSTCEDANAAGLISKTALWLGLKLNCFQDADGFVRNALCAELDACAAFSTAKPTSDLMIFTSLIPLHVPPPSPMRRISALILWLQAHFTQPPGAKHGSGTAHWFTLCRDRAETSRQAVSDFIYLFIYFCLVWRKCAHFISSDGSAVNRMWLRMSRRVGQSSIRLLRSVSVRNTFRAKLQHVILLVIISSGP